MTAPATERPAKTVIDIGDGAIDEAIQDVSATEAVELPSTARALTGSVGQTSQGQHAQTEPNRLEAFLPLSLRLLERRIRLMPRSGSPGSSVQVEVWGFAGGETVKLTFFDSTLGNVPLERIQADASGGFTAWIIPPNATLGRQHVRARELASGAVARRPFTVTPSGDCASWTHHVTEVPKYAYPLLGRSLPYPSGHD